MLLGILSQALIQLVIPAYLLQDLYRKKNFTSLSRHLLVVSAGLVIVIVYFVARWDLTSYYLRFAWPILFILAAVKIYRRPLLGDDKQTKFKSALAGTGVLLGLLITGFIIAGRMAPAQAVDLAAPLRGGQYYVAHGGGATILNYHHPSTSQKYALDISRLSALGNDVAISKNLEDYPIYGDKIHSPCSGRVVESVNNLPNLIPPQADKKNKAGNHVVLSCDNQQAKVLLAHMKQGSVTAVKGETVRQGEIVGQVGNSGNTTQPHLHIHAVAPGEDILKGKGIPITFNGKFLTRNDILR